MIDCLPRLHHEMRGLTFDDVVVVPGEVAPRPALHLMTVALRSASTLVQIGADTACSRATS